MDLNTIPNRRELIDVFPNLNTDSNFIITSPTTSSYNCIAWAMGYNNRWVQPINIPNIDNKNARFNWWPPGVEVSVKCEALIEAFVALGFELTDNTHYELGYDKAVLYTNGQNWTHASRIVAEGIEHSKFGESWDASHGCNKFNSTVYGYPYAYMKRLHSKKQYYLDKYPIKIGDIIIHEEQLEKMLEMLRKLKGIK